MITPNRQISQCNVWVGKITKKKLFVVKMQNEKKPGKVSLGKPQAVFRLSKRFNPPPQGALVN